MTSKNRWCEDKELPLLSLLAILLHHRISEFSRPV